MVAIVVDYQDQPPAAIDLFRSGLNLARLEFFFALNAHLSFPSSGR